MYGYLSLLNYQGHFDTIQVNYLIVGHTHGPIDQYFSVLSHKLYDQAFVGSPMALQCLFGECESPQIVRQLWVHRDWKSWLHPYINKLKLISLPHVVLFTRELGISIFQHKAFSSKPDFLPLKPQGVQMITDPERLIELSISGELRLEQFGQFGGFAALHKALIGAEVTTESLIKNTEQNRSSSLFSGLLPQLLEFDYSASTEADVQAEYESEHGYLSTIVPMDDNEKGMAELVNAGNILMLGADNAPAASFDRFTQTLEVSQAYADFLKKSGTETAGYCLMLNYHLITKEWLNSKPKVFNYIEQVT